MLNTSIQIKTDFFDGPLALLLHLLQEQEMDIRQLDLTSVTQQYLRYLDQMKELNFDVAGEYLWLAANLIWLKSRACLDHPEDDEEVPDFVAESGITSQEELVRRLLMLQHFQQLGRELWKLPKKGHQIFCKPKVDRRSIINSILTPMDLSSLTEAMLDYYRREARAFKVIIKEKIPVREKLAILKQILQPDENYEFTAVLAQCGNPGVGNTIATFIAFLELARLGKVSILQNEVDQKIYIHVLESLADFDVNTAHTIEDEEEGSAEAAEPAPNALAAAPAGLPQ